MTIDEQRAGVISEAMTWQGTPHHNGARIKGVGVDCGQFPIAVYSEVGLMPAITTQRYSPQFHLHRDEEWYKKLADQFGKIIDGPPLPGDFALYKIGRIYSHGAIVIKWPRIIHAMWGIGVTQDEGDQGRQGGRDVLFYTMSKWVE